MVCSLERGRMAVMARLLEAQSLSPIAEKVNSQKLSAQNIYRALHEADDANLLDEKDMHIFGLKPTADPLNLVCCNSCKKPVRESQYAAHSELCRLLIASEECTLDANGGTGHRKPPRKERKKLLSTQSKQDTRVWMQQRSNSIDVGNTSLLSEDVKNAAVTNPSGVGSQYTDQSSFVTLPSTKRSKLIAGESLQVSGDPKTTYGVTNMSSDKQSHTYRDFSEQVIPRSEMVISNAVGCNSPWPVHEHSQTQDIPVPLATKIYYSQRNNRLKSTFKHIFQESSTKEHCGDVVIPEALKQNSMPLHDLSQVVSSDNQVNDLLNQKLQSSTHMPDKVLEQSSEPYFTKSGGCLPAANISNQFQADNVPRQQTNIGLTGSKYLSKTYPCVANSGKLLGNSQQPNGSVPVV